MCGIAGIVGRPGQLDALVLQNMMRRLQHRGPDDKGFVVCSRDGARAGRDLPDRPIPGYAALVHRRLSILDLTDSGWQPMESADRQRYIVFNGEIYNYRELRRELEGLGYQFNSRSDTEVLLAAYVQWGHEALVRLVGMFAFAVLDLKERKLFAARDSFGIKPLYYRFWNQAFVFASELKTLLELPGVKRLANAGIVYSYLRFGLTDHSSETFFKGIFQLPAAHYLEVRFDDPCQAHAVPYWKAKIGDPIQISFQAAAERVRELFLENIRLHLRSDVAVGAALSGGIDSSAIVAAIRSVQGANVDLHTFSYTAADLHLNEEKWVDIMGRATGASVHKTGATPEDLATDLNSLISVQEEPFNGTSIYAQYRVFRLANEFGIKVMLDGQGADEIFGGYRYYMAARLASLIRRGRWGEAVSFLRRSARLPGSGRWWLLLRAMSSLLPGRYVSTLRPWFGQELYPRWLNARWFKEHGVAPAPLEGIKDCEILRQNLLQALTVNSLPHLLRYEDRNSMAFSIESRVPYLTPELVSFALSLPEEHLIDIDGTSKAVLRKAMRGIVPDIILDRKDKIGFATPDEAWLKWLSQSVGRALSLDERSPIPALNWKCVRQEWRKVAEGRKEFNPRMWRWANLVWWSNQFCVSHE